MSTLNTSAIAGEIKVTTNNRERPLRALSEIPEDERRDFDYITGEETGSPRLFHFRDSWFDVGEFAATEGEMSQRGWHGIQTQSAFDAILVRYPHLAEGDTSCVVVGHASW